MSSKKQPAAAAHVHGPDCQHEHHAAARPAQNPHKHIGRNDLCPCGSGKKFKKCHAPAGGSGG